MNLLPKRACRGMADNNSLTFSGLDSEVFVCLSDADSLKTEEG